MSEPTTAAGRQLLVVLGDAVTAGYCLDRVKAYLPRIEQEAAARAEPPLTVERLMAAIPANFGDFWDEKRIPANDGSTSWEATFNRQRFATAILAALAATEP